MKNKSKITLIVIVLISISLVIFGYLVLTDKIFIENKNNNEIDKNTSTNINSEKDEKSILFTYTSGDNNAEKGNPEILTIYSKNDKEMDFKYHAIWNEEDINGTASRIDTDKYIHISNNNKIEFSFKDDSVEVKEYINNELNSTVNLFK